MSCNQEHFINEERVCENTYLSRLPNNIDYIIYRGGNNTELNGHILTVEAEDDLNNTYNKTYQAINYIVHNMNYDYIFRTNTSTYVNIDLLNAFVQSLPNDGVIWTSELFCDLQGDYRLPYGRGNGLLIPFNELYILLKEGFALSFIKNHLIDDSTIGCIYNSYRIKNHDRFYDYIKSYKEGWYKATLQPYSNHQVCNMNNTCKDFDFLKQMITIQIRNWYDRSLEEKHFYEIDEVFKNNKDEDIDNTVKSQYNYSKNPDIFLGHTIGYKLFNQVFKIKKEEQ